MPVDRRSFHRPPAVDRTPGPVVVPIATESDLPLVLVGSSEAELRGATLELLHVVPSRWSPIVTGRAGRPPARPRGHDDRDVDALRARALTLARLCAGPVRWTTALGSRDTVVEGFCRDHSAALLVIGADREQLTSRRLRSTLVRARRLSHRAGTPLHLVCRG